MTENSNPLNGIYPFICGHFAETGTPATSAQIIDRCEAEYYKAFHATAETLEVSDEEWVTGHLGHVFHHLNALVDSGVVVRTSTSDTEKHYRPADSLEMTKLYQLAFIR